MFWRRMVADDLITCLDIDPAHVGHELIGPRRAVAAWQWLLKSPAFRGFTVVSEGPIDGHDTIGFGSGVFVSNAFADGESGRPRPGTNARILASICTGRPVVVTAEELRKANSLEGVNLVLLTSAIRTAALDRRQLDAVRTQLWLACLHHYLGYRLRLLLREAPDAADIAYMTAQAVYGRVFAFDDFHQQHPNSSWNRDRALMVSTREDAAARPGSIPAILYAFRAPVLGLSAAHQRLLEAALLGLTDEELGEALALKVPAVKKRWAAAFDHIACVKPGLLPCADKANGHHTRGRQKRHHLLAYLREHPEELRPWYSTRNSKG